MRRVSVLVVDDHAVFADALQARLAAEADLAPVYVAYSLSDGSAQLAAHRPDVVLLDVLLADGSGLELARHARQTAPTTRVIMLTAVESAELAADALLAGADGWLPKAVDTAQLVDAIHALARGEAVLDGHLLGQVLAELRTRGAGSPRGPLGVLTEREREVLDCLALGMSRDDISARMHVSVHTVRTHVRNLSAKLDVHSALEAVALRNRLQT